MRAALDDERRDTIRIQPLAWFEVLDRHTDLVLTFSSLQCVSRCHRNISTGCICPEWGMDPFHPPKVG
jgi:hypothetical protein